MGNGSDDGLIGVLREVEDGACFGGVVRLEDLEDGEEKGGVGLLKEGMK